MDVALAEATSANTKKQKAMMVKSKKKSSKVVINMFGKLLYSYFAHWKQLTQEKKQFSDTKLKDRILRTYYATMRTYLLHWKK